jgi:DNA-directed RNA polymerase specialized sigma54-like protein
MAAIGFLSNEMDIAETLGQDHEEIRADLAKTMRQRGAVGEAARRLADLCLPHFEVEEKMIFPVLRRLDGLVSRNEPLGDLAADLQEQIADLTRQHKHFNAQHESISAAVEKLLAAAYKDGHREAAELAYIIRNHEGYEDELDLSAYQANIQAIYRP